MNHQDIDLTSCEREPIHIPGSIQPHGLLLVVDPDTGKVTNAAGDVERRLGRGDWLGAHIESLLGPEIAAAILRTLLPRLEASAHAFDEADDLPGLLATAAREFRRLTGYDRVMVYRFLDDQAGKVVAEDAASHLHSFMNHHFPASDIPAQARALYVRNLVRVIPDVHYRPMPLNPKRPADRPLDMSDCSLRSVSPVHIQYLKNMGVAASASFSIVKDGELWGLIACHNFEPRGLPLDVRVACRALSTALTRQIKAREDTNAFRERIRLGTFEDRIMELLLREGSLNSALANHLPELQQMFAADGVAVLRGEDLAAAGKCPPRADIRALAEWICSNSPQPVFAADELATTAAPPQAVGPLSAGLLSMILSASERWTVLWFRAEVVEVVNWAGNPHKAATAGAGGLLTPRASFDAWSETVRGKARRWSDAEVEGAERLAVATQNVWQTRRIRGLNKELLTLIDQKEALLKQRAFLLGEVNHRVQNSLTLVNSFLSLQARESSDPVTRGALEEARRRISAVSLVHRRLYGSDQIHTVDGARYIDDLLDDLLGSMDPEWQSQVVRDLQPVLLPNDRAISIGLILTELVINANKYAYGGAPGPVRVTLAENGNSFRLRVADNGKGRGAASDGFGARMLDVLVRQLGGTLEFADNQPGTRAILSAPTKFVSGSGEDVG